MQVLEKSGERGRNRTYNLLIKSQLLCQLSYAPAPEVLTGENSATCAAPREDYSIPRRFVTLSQPDSAMPRQPKKSA